MTMAKTVWTEEARVRASETDFRSRWKVASFFSVMMEAAGHHASSLGFDYAGMMQNDMVWVLSRLKIVFEAFPVMGEAVTIQTWPKGIQQKLFFMRDYKIYSADGNCLAAATSAYVLMSPRARRILLPQALPGQVPHNDGFSAIDEPLEKIPTVEPLESILTTQASYSAVDLMGHVNNTRYVEWICDSFSFQEHQAGTIQSLQINYVNEVKPGETIALARAHLKNNANGWYVTGTNQSTGLKAFDAEIHWKPA